MLSGMTANASQNWSWRPFVNGPMESAPFCLLLLLLAACVGSASSCQGRPGHPTTVRAEIHLTSASDLEEVGSHVSWRLMRAGIRLSECRRLAEKVYEIAAVQGTHAAVTAALTSPMSVVAYRLVGAESPTGPAELDAIRRWLSVDNHAQRIAEQPLAILAYNATVTTGVSWVPIVSGPLCEDLAQLSVVTMECGARRFACVSTMTPFLLVGTDVARDDVLEGSPLSVASGGQDGHDAEPVGVVVSGEVFAHGRAEIVGHRARLWIAGPHATVLARQVRWAAFPIVAEVDAIGR